MNTKAEPDKAQQVIYVQRTSEEEDTAFVKAAYALMYAGPIIQTLLVITVGFVGYKWAVGLIDWASWLVHFGQTKSHEAVMLRTEAWLIFASFFFMVVQIVGALLMPFNVKVGQVVTVGLNVIPMVALLWVAFHYLKLDLQLDDLQRCVLWFQMWSVLGGFLIGLGARMAIMSGRKTGNIITGGT
jgi:hypothetical protein